MVFLISIRHFLLLDVLTNDRDPNHFSPSQYYHEQTEAVCYDTLLTASRSGLNALFVFLYWQLPLFFLNGL